MTSTSVISVVIPALNEQAGIGRCLDSLAVQDFPGDVEVIVVDNGSTDATAQIARARGATVLSEPVRGVCHARQTGTAAARGEIVVSTDADTAFPPDWLSQIAAQLSSQDPAQATEDAERVATCGPCRFVDGPSWSRPYTKALFGVTTWMYRRTGRVLYASATNIAFRRSAWTGYDTTLTQGGDELGLLRSLRRAGEIHWDATRTTLTSSRRLYRGLVYNTLVTCLFFYLFAYNINRLAGRTVIGAAPAIRPDSSGRPSTRRSKAKLAAAATALLLSVSWWLTPLDVV